MDLVAFHTFMCRQSISHRLTSLSFDFPPSCPMNCTMIFPELDLATLTTTKDQGPSKLEDDFTTTFNKFFNDDKGDVVGTHDKSQIGMSFINVPANFEQWHTSFDHSKLQEAIALAGMKPIDSFSPTTVSNSSFEDSEYVKPSFQQGNPANTACMANSKSISEPTLQVTTSNSSQTQLIACDLCGRMFKKRGSVARHKNAVHLGVRPFRCNVCGFCFQQRCDLRKHVQSVHKQERPFACDVQGCKAAFSRRAKLRKHIATVHLKQRNFVCTICQMAFGEKSNMNKHIRAVHLQLRRHACRWCPATFKELGHCTKHMNTQHKELARF